jgi:hypothetical protein
LSPRSISSLRSSASSSRTDTTGSSKSTTEPPRSPSDSTHVSPSRSSLPNPRP